MSRSYVVNVDELDWKAHERGSAFAARRKKLAASAGGRGLGASLYEVPGGCAAFPRHAHLGNEEAIFVLEGHGTLRRGDEEQAVRPGDWIALPSGEEHAHQLVADPDTILRYLCVSTQAEPDVVRYPDSGKLGVFAGAAPGGPKEERTVGSFHRTDDAVDYWDGET